MTLLEGNNSVSTFYQTQRQFNIDLGSFSPISLYNFFSNNLVSKEKSCLIFNATAQLSVPSYVNFTVSGGTGQKQQNVPIVLPSSVRSIYLNVTIPSNSLLVPILIKALVYQNGTVYQAYITQSGA